MQKPSTPPVSGKAFWTLVGITFATFWLAIVFSPLVERLLKA